jgi:hypothetical protein
VHEAGVVIALVEVLENRGEDLGFFVGQGDPLGRAVGEVVAAKGVLEEGRGAEDVFVSGEETLFAADDEGDDGGCEVAGGNKN